jgi:DNA repair protein RadC
MKEVAPHDRPREKLARLGSQGLGDNELLALVVGSGCRSADALTLANRILSAVGGLSGLTRLAAGELCRVAGVGPARAGRIQAAVELGRRTLAESGDRTRLTSPRQLAALLLPRYGACAVEQFGVVLLDTKRRVIRIKVLSVGSLDMTVVHPREVFREAAAASAAAIALFHNHPSGDPAPSSEDLELTARMLRAGEVMGIDVVDHLILADQRYVSLSEIGALIGRGVARPG